MNLKTLISVRETGSVFLFYFIFSIFCCSYERVYYFACMSLIHVYFKAFIITFLLTDSHSWNGKSTHGDIFNNWRLWLFW